MIFGFCLIILIFLSSFLSASETALFSLSVPTLRSYRASSDHRQEMIADMMDRPRDVLVTILILNIISNLLVQNTVSTIFDPFPSWLLKVGVPLVLVLIFGELIPKSLAYPNNQRIARRVAPFIYFLMRLLNPIQVRLNQLAGFISRLFFFFLPQEEEVSTDELRHIIETSRDKNILLSQEADMIGGALNLEERTVKEVMRHRDDVIFFDIHRPIPELKDLFFQQKCSRIPVCDRELDRLLGIVSLRRFLASSEKIQTAEDLQTILKKPFFIPESTICFSLLSTLRETGEEMAFAVDEYGSITGLVTQHDLVQMVLGEASDQKGERSLYSRAGQDAIIASAKMEINDFEKLFHVRLPTKENPVTLGGWLIDQLGEIPSAGTKYATDDFLFYVLAAEPNRIRRIYVRRIHTTKYKR